MLATQLGSYEDHVLRKSTVTTVGVTPITPKFTGSRRRLPTLVVGRTVGFDSPRSYGQHVVDHYVQLVVAICKKSENGIVPFGTIATDVYIYLVAHLVARDGRL